MTRYFLDTGVLVGLTFLHDLWYDEAERVFDNDNGLYTSRAVVYEYCNSTESNRLEEATVDWETEDGLYGRKLSKVRVAQMNLNMWLDGCDNDELDIERLVEAFLEETDVNRKVKPPELIERYIQPNIKAFLEAEIDDEVTRLASRKALDGLCDTVIDGAKETREMIQSRVAWGPSGTRDEEERNRRLGFVDGYVDKVILCDAEHQSDLNLIEKVVTSDRSHMYQNRERIRAVLGIPVIYIKDEFADHDLPSGK